ncbi:SPOR domain-containing protein [Azotobacter beijerinckii]|nr:SPOR domain-containing protein [Azotobacter beijerinckii]
MAWLDRGLKQRMVGALVLLALAVIFLPILFTREDEVRQVVVEAPPMPETPPASRVELEPVAVPEPVILPEDLQPSTVIAGTSAAVAPTARAASAAAAGTTPKTPAANPVPPPAQAKMAEAKAAEAKAAQAKMAEAKAAEARAAQAKMAEAKAAEARAAQAKMAEAKAAEARAAQAKMAEAKAAEAKAEQAKMAEAKAAEARAAQAKMAEVKPAEAKATEASRLDANGLPVSWSIQLASLSSTANAQDLQRTLRSQGYNAYIRHVDGMNRVYVGPVIERAEANRLCDQLKRQHNLGGFVVRFQPERG